MARLGAASEPELEVAVLRSIAGKLDEEELKALKELFSRRGEKRWAGGAQLEYMGAKEPLSQGDGAFLV